MWKYFFLKANTKIRWLFSLISSAYIVIFSYLLEPLKNEIINYDYPLYYNFIAMLACLISFIIFSIFIPILFPLFFSKDNWTFNRFIIWLIGLCVSTAYASYLFDAWAYQFSDLSFSLFQIGRASCRERVCLAV